MTKQQLKSISKTINFFNKDEVREAVKNQCEQFKTEILYCAKGVNNSDWNWSEVSELINA